MTSTPPANPVPQPRPSTPWDNPAPVRPGHPAYARRINPTDAQTNRYRQTLAALDGDNERQANVTVGHLIGALNNLMTHIEARPELLAAAPDLVGMVREGKAVIWAWDETIGWNAAVRRG